MSTAYLGAGGSIRFSCPFPMIAAGEIGDVVLYTSGDMDGWVCAPCIWCWGSMGPPCTKVAAMLDNDDPEDELLMMVAGYCC